MCSRQCYSCLFIQYIAVSYFTTEMHSQIKSSTVNTYRTNYSIICKVFIRYNRFTSFWGPNGINPCLFFRAISRRWLLKSQNKAINATKCSISQTSYSTFCNGKELVLITGFGITNSSKKFTSLTLNEQQCGSQSHEKNPKSERAVKRGWRFWFLFREDMIICRCQNNSRTFFSAILRVLIMRPGFEPVTFRRWALIKFNWYI